MIYLVRHGETAWNIEGRRQGHGDSPLTASGISQAESIGQRLLREPGNNRPVQIICSPLARAVTTASIIARQLGMEEGALLIEPMLIEQHMGRWEGLTNAQIKELYPDDRKCRRQNRWEYTIHGGENLKAVYERSAAWLAGLSEDRTVVAVAHDIINRMIRGAYCRLAPDAILELRHPNDVIYLLAGGTAEPIRCK